MTELIDRRYPIGKFEHGKTYSIDETRQQIKTIARLPKELKKALKKLRDGALDKPYRAGGWTARQVIHHLADSHMNAYVRFKLAVTEDAPIIKPYEEKKWAETEDGKHGSAKTAIRLLTALHERWIDFITSLTDDELDRAYFHPANKRSVTLREAIALYAWHSKHHLAHVRLVIEGGKEKTAKADKREETRPSAETTKAAPAPKQLEAPAKVASSDAPVAAPAQKRTMSPEHKAKIIAAQQKRWAAAKGTADAPAVPKAEAEPKAAAPKAKPAPKAAAKKEASADAVPAKKRTMSPEHKAKIIAAQQKRWAAAKSTDAPAAPKQKAEPKAKATPKAAAPKAAAKETSADTAPAKKRTMSPEHKAKIIAAQQKRWAAAKGTADAPAAPKAKAESKSAAPKAKAAPKAAAPKAKPAPKAAAKKESSADAVPAKKRTMSPEHKAKIIAAQQKRWAEQKAKK
jgi:uncharacterized damage-inducible protein DinB